MAQDTGLGLRRSGRMAAASAPNSDCLPPSRKAAGEATPPADAAGSKKSKRAVHSAAEQVLPNLQAAPQTPGHTVSISQNFHCSAGQVPEDTVAWHPTLLAMQLQALFPGSQTCLQLSAELCTQCPTSSPPSPTLHRAGMQPEALQGAGGRRTAKRQKSDGSFGIPVSAVPLVLMTATPPLHPTAPQLAAGQAAHRASNTNPATSLSPSRAPGQAGLPAAPGHSLVAGLHAQLAGLHPLPGKRQPQDQHAPSRSQPSSDSSRQVTATLPPKRRPAPRNGFGGPSAAPQPPPQAGSRHSPAGPGLEQPAAQLLAAEHLAAGPQMLGVLAASAEGSLAGLQHRAVAHAGPAPVSRAGLPADAGTAGPGLLRGQGHAQHAAAARGPMQGCGPTRAAAAVGPQQGDAGAAAEGGSFGHQDQDWYRHFASGAFPEVCDRPEPPTSPPGQARDSLDWLSTALAGFLRWTQPGSMSSSGGRSAPAFQVQDLQRLRVMLTAASNRDDLAFLALTLGLLHQLPVSLTHLQSSNLVHIVLPLTQHAHSRVAEPARKLLSLWRRQAWQCAVDTATTSHPANHAPNAA